MEEIHNNSLLEWWKEKTLADCTDCYRHPYCVFCQMCAGNNFIANGTPLKPSENNCYIAKERYNLALKIREGYDPLHGKTLEERLVELTMEIPALHRNYSNNYRNKNGVNEMSQ